MLANELPQRSTLGLLLLTALLALLGCSDGGGTPKPCGEAECDELDAGSPSRPPTAAIKDSGMWRNVTAPSDASADGAPPDLDLPLQLRIQVNGQNLPCGACGVVIAQAQGGRRPYTYEWNDPALQGPGPHTVCPTADKQYTLKITDSTPNMVGEFASTAQVAEASADFVCLPDAGAGTDFVGCKTGSSFDTPTMESASQVVHCEGTTDGGVLTEHGAVSTTITSSPVLLPIAANKPHQFIYDHLLPVVLGKGVSVDVYGAMNDRPCEKLEKLFSFNLDGTWHQSLCFTPKQNYERIVTHISLNGVWFWFELGQVGTVCTGCPM